MLNGGGFRLNFTIDKSMVTEMSGNKCERQIINRLVAEWHKEMKKLNHEARKDKKEEPYHKDDFDNHYIAQKLGPIPTRDTPPLTTIKKEGQLAELYKIVEIARNNNIFSTKVNEGEGIDYEDSEREIEYFEYPELSIKENSTITSGVIIGPSNVKEFKKRLDDLNADKDNFIVEFEKSMDIREDFAKVFNSENNYRFVYQPSFPTTNDVYVDLIGKENICEMIPENVNIVFKSIRPDLVEIIPPSGNSIKVLDKNHNTVEGSPHKVKLKVYDIKMSDFKSKFFVEISYYVMALNNFLYKFGLDDMFEVCSESAILPYDSTKIYREEIANFEEIDKWVVKFESERSKLYRVFKYELPEVFRIIVDGDVDNYNKFIITSKCQTCDFYGKQYSNHLHSELKKSKPGQSKINYEEMDSFYETSNYCRYCAIRDEDINTLPVLSDGEKKQLKNIGITNKKSLLNAINSQHSIFNDNKTLKANLNRISSWLQKDVNDFQPTLVKHAKHTLMLPNNPSISIFLDERHDTQKRTLSLAYNVVINSNEAFNVFDFSECPDTKPVEQYVSVIESYSPYEEIKCFLNYMIKINYVLDYYESAKWIYNNSEKHLTFAFYYWNEDAIEHLKELFIKSLVLLFKLDFTQMSKEEDIIRLREIYMGSSDAHILNIKRELKKIVERFNVFFTSDEQLEDFRAVENNPFFSVKDAVEDLYVINTDFNINLNKTAQLFYPKGQIRNNERFYKPDSDNFNGSVFSKLWKHWTDDADRVRYINSTINNLIFERLSSLKSIVWNIRQGDYQVKLKGEAPPIPQRSRITNYNNIKYGNEIMMMHMLDVAFSLINTQNNHYEDIEKKVILSRTLQLDSLIEGEQRNRILNELNIADFHSYRVYNINPNSQDVKLDKNSFSLTMLPVENIEYLFKKFTTSEAYGSYPGFIYLDENEFQYIDNFYFWNNRQLKDRFKVSIAYLDRINLIAVIHLEDAILEVLQYLEINEGLDFSNNVIVEQTHFDIWESRLKEILKKFNQAKSLEGKKLFEELLTEPICDVNEQKLLELIGDYYQDIIPLNSNQKRSIVNLINQRISILWGPPGTGKTHTLLHLLMYFYKALTEGKVFKVLLLGNYDATENILKKVAEVIDNQNVGLYRIYSESKTSIGLSNNTNCNVIEVKSEKNEVNAFKEVMRNNNLAMQIYSVTPEQYLKVFSTKFKFQFDLVIIDEASQMTVGKALPAFLNMNANTRLVIAGDYLQLAPITNVDVNNPNEYHWGSIFDYYKGKYKNYLSEPIFNVLDLNRRSNEIIVNYGTSAFSYQAGYMADAGNAKRRVQYVKESLANESYLNKVLDPNRAMALIKYDDGISHQSNVFEELIIIEIIQELWDRGLSIDGQKLNLLDFFSKGIGVVLPHRAQRTKIQNRLVELFVNDEFCHEQGIIDRGLLVSKITSSVDTVEKYQGQEREIMICGYVVGDPEYIRAEEEFLFNPNRLNVMISRARSKAIILIANEVLEHNSDEFEITKAKQSLDYLVKYCDQEEVLIEDRWSSVNAKLIYKSW